MKRVAVWINTESGCNAAEGEYSLFLAQISEPLDLSAVGGNDDISLIRECIADDLDFSLLPEDGQTEIWLQESGEWEDVFWHKYYVIESVNVLDDHDDN